jgi:hypothetical protein
MNATSRGRLLLLGATAAIVVAACSGDSATTTEDDFFEITYSTELGDTGKFNGVICDMGGRYRGEDGAGGAIEISIEASGESGTVRIDDEALEANATILSVVYSGQSRGEISQFPLEISAQEGSISKGFPVQVSVDFSESADCSN